MTLSHFTIKGPFTGPSNSESTETLYHSNDDTEEVNICFVKFIEW